MLVLPYYFVLYEELYNAYLDCRKHKWKTANAATFQINLSENLYKLWVDLNQGTYQIGRSIAFIVKKPVCREVFAADFRDRIVHHLVINRLIVAYELSVIPNSFSCRVGKGTHYGIMTLFNDIRRVSENYTKDTYILKCDLKSFFMTINKELLNEKIDKLLKEKVYPNGGKDYFFTSKLVRQIIMNCPQEGCVRKSPNSDWINLPKDKSLFYNPPTHGIPIGNLTSQIFANYFLNDFDNYVLKYLGFPAYGRYVDDFYIISNNKQELIDAIPQIKVKLAEIGVKLHPNKIYIQNVFKGVKFIGGVVKPHRIYTNKRTVGNFKAALYKFQKEFQEKTVTSEMVNKLVSSCNSYFGFMRHYASFNVRKNIIRGKYMELFLKYAYFNDNLNKMVPFKEYSPRNKGISIEDYWMHPGDFLIKKSYSLALIFVTMKKH